MYYTRNQKNDTSLKSLENLTPVELQNHFHGLIWGLMNKGRIFEKLLLHPLIQNIRCGPAMMSLQEAPRKAPRKPLESPQKVPRKHPLVTTIAQSRFDWKF